MVGLAARVLPLLPGLAAQFDAQIPEGIPAEYFVEAAAEFGRLGHKHAIFLSGPERSELFGSAAGVFHTEYGITQPQDLARLAAVFRLRFAYLALGGIAKDTSE